MGIKATFQKVIDEVQFQYDVFPKSDYQPLPWVGINQAHRGEGTNARWKAIETSLTGLSLHSGMDIGCNFGYFCFALAQTGVAMLGVDMDSRCIRIARYASGKIGVAKVGLCQMEINTATVALLPSVDLTLLLSVWHHWVRAYGLTQATQILSTVWNKTEQVLFFETGETEMSPDFGLPAMGASSQKWVEDYLTTVCVGAKIVQLGQFKAFAPLGNENRNVVYRNLFKVTRLNA